MTRVICEVSQAGRGTYVYVQCEDDTTTWEQEWAKAIQLLVVAYIEAEGGHTAEKVSGSEN